MSPPQPPLPATRSDSTGPSGSSSCPACPDRKLELRCSGPSLKIKSLTPEKKQACSRGAPPLCAQDLAPHSSLAGQLQSRAAAWRVSSRLFPISISAQSFPQSETPGQKSLHPEQMQRCPFLPSDGRTVSPVSPPGRGGAVQARGSRERKGWLCHKKGAPFLPGGLLHLLSRGERKGQKERAPTSFSLPTAGFKFSEPKLNICMIPSLPQANSPFHCGPGRCPPRPCICHSCGR